MICFRYKVDNNIIIIIIIIIIISIMKKLSWTACDNQKNTFIREVYKLFCTDQSIYFVSNSLVLLSLFYSSSDKSILVLIYALTVQCDKLPKVLMSHKVTVCQNTS